MNIVKTIKLSDDNLQEIMECPVVYRISKLELEPTNQELIGSDLGTKEKPSLVAYVQGFRKPCLLKEGYLAQDDKGYWRCLSKNELEELNDAK